MMYIAVTYMSYKIIVTDRVVFSTANNSDQFRVVQQIKLHQ
jgi:hypothetical protein